VTGLDNVLVNTRTLGATHLTGVQRYTSELLEHLKITQVPPRQPLDGLKGHLWEQLVLPTKLGQKLLWSPANTGPLSVKHQLVTIHDASTLDHPEWFTPNFAALYGWLLPKLVRRVQGVLTVSQFAKDRLLYHSGVQADKIQVVPLAANQKFSPQPNHILKATKEKYTLPEHYLLSVGSLEPRKNLMGLLAAWLIFSNQYPDLRLAISGAKGKAFRDAGLGELPKSVQLLGYVEERDLPALYTGAVGFVYPSLYEGFGLPPLEAMACGCPVIVSNAASLPEVCGDAALYCDPHDPKDIAEKIKQLVENPSLQESLRQKGLEQAKRFTWEKCAQETLAVIQKVLEQPR
jgi:glycosyltransferase involved in cell wall biosynthesis